MAQHNDKDLPYLTENDKAYADTFKRPKPEKPDKPDKPAKPDKPVRPTNK